MTSGVFHIFVYSHDLRNFLKGVSKYVIDWQYHHKTWGASFRGLGPNVLLEKQD